MTPSCNAAAAMIALSVEPGSYGSVTARFTPETVCPVLIVIGIEIRSKRPCEDCASVGIHNQDRATLRFGLFHRGIQLLFSNVLDYLVDSERQPVAFIRLSALITHKRNSSP